MPRSSSRIRRTSLSALLALAILTTTGAGPSSAEPAVSPKTGTLRFGVSVPGGPLDAWGMAHTIELAGEVPSAELWYEDFEQPLPIAKLDAVRSRGAQPVITWEPWQWGGGLEQPRYALARIAGGEHDAHIRAWAAGMRDWGKPVTLRFAHEMNGDWYPWGAATNGNRPGDYIAAWRHVHDVFVSEGATNVTWMWSPNTPYWGSAAMTDFYPGANFVDVVALDGYNWGAIQPWSTWTTPGDLFGPGLTELRAIAPGKPIVVAETASTEIGGAKATWVKALIAYLAAQPDVIGFIWFNHIKETDWRIDSSPASATAFAAALAARKKPAATCTNCRALP